jgi:hypothetical protein
MNLKYIKTASKCFILPLVLIMLVSCGDFLDVNKDPNNPTSVSEAPILTGILVNFAYEIVGGYPVRVTNTWVKQTTYNASLPSYDNYLVTENDSDNLWTFYSYTDVMENCKLLKEMANKDKAYDYAAIAQIITAWNMSIITDLFNNAPYTEAWQIEKFPQPKYDTQESIYTNIQSLLDSAIANIDRTDKHPTIIPKQEDFIYRGDMEKWKMLAYTLKARFYLRLTYAPHHSPVEQANLALEAISNGFLSSDDDALYAYKNEVGQENPWYQYAISGNWDNSTQISNHYISLLKDLKDPRLHAQAQLVDTIYQGHENGEDAESDLSAIGDYYSKADASLELLTFAEAKFIEAEARFLTGDRPGAVSAMKDGLVADFEPLTEEIEKRAKKLKIMNIQDSITTYIDKVTTLSKDDKEAYGQLMVQKYITNFLQFETYNDWRRTGYPEITIAANPYVEDLQTPALRFPYPSSELQYNSANVDAQGVQKGFRGVGSPVWWDSCNDCCPLCEF